MQNITTRLPKTDFEQIYNEITHNSPAFLKRPFIFSWWVNGGEPGPDYVTTALNISNKEGKLEGQFVEGKFDFQATPHQYAERHTGVLSSESVIQLLRAVLESGLLIKEFPAEQDTHIAGMLKETWKFHFGSTKVEKTFFEPFPQELASVRVICQMLIKQLPHKTR